ncbi:MAG: RDD family protein [Tepidisphaeraceae bacterium]
MDWFYAQNGRQVGPVTLDALLAMLQGGHVQPGDLVWREGMADWQSAATMAELTPAIPSASASLNYFNPVAGPFGPPIYAGFWMRFAAAIIDGIVLGMAGSFINMAMGLELPILRHHGNSIPLAVFAILTVGFGSGMAVEWLYHALMETSRYQGSLGKMALGIVVTDMSGQRITFGRATGRYFGKIISKLTIYIGFMMAGWTEQKQALHDIMAGCLVMRKR